MIRKSKEVLYLNLVFLQLLISLVQGGVLEHRLAPEGAMGEVGGAQGGIAGDPGRPLDLQATVQSLIRSLQDVVQYVPAEPEEEGDWSSDSD